VAGKGEYPVYIRISMFSLIALLGIVMCWQLAVGETSTAVSRHSVTPKKVIGYLTYWKHTEGLQTIKKHRVFTEISPFWYSLDSSGEIGLFEANWYRHERNVIEGLRRKNISIVPTLANNNDRGWDAAIVSQILNNSARMKIHIDNIVELVVSNNYDGIDIDYESLYGHDRDAFSKFIKELAVALHAQDKILSVVVSAKIVEPGSSSNRVYDYATLGQAADQVRIMAYNYHWTASVPGPIAPIHWVERVTSFAASKIPKEKIILGFALYGIDWVNRLGKEIEWEEVLTLVNTNGAKVRWDSESSSPWFEYREADETKHVVWFENSYSIEDKLYIAREHDVAGVFFWDLGGEHQRTWQVVRTVFLNAMTNTGDLAPKRAALDDK
jgi:spore germination protein